MKKLMIQSIGAIVVLLNLWGCQQDTQVFEKEHLKTPAVNDDRVQSVLNDNNLCVLNPTSAACVAAPIAKRPSVATILLTLSQVERSAAELIIINVVRQVSPVSSPKILFLEDSNLHGEDIDDVTFVHTFLQKNNIVVKKIAQGGLKAEEVVGFDIVWIINPGHPLEDSLTKTTLQNFNGSIVLQGDDMAQGNQSLTGLAYVSNGTVVSCNGNSYGFDNLLGHNYSVTMTEEFLSGIAQSLTSSIYGNDIDHTKIAIEDGKTKVLAWASTSKELCEAKVPAIVVREK